MQRIAVVGPGGAGKSTLADALGRVIGVPVVHLDRHFWKPGWVETPRDEWEALQQSLFAGDGWVADGNYGGTLDVRLARADTVIIFCPSRLQCMRGAITRSLRNYGRAVQAEGCPERFDPTFLKWVWRYRSDSRPRLDAAIARHSDHLEVIELTSRRQAAALLARLTDEF